MKSSDIANLARVDEKPVKGISISLNAAKVFVSILFIISAEILWLMIQANPLNLVQEAAFGVGLGVLLIIVGIGIRIYRLAYYYE